ncbi:integrase domain-containing protein [Saezia sanguinis]|uniref:integrase domain-containing protein n=1 Tax=Saezia sanguinis TaxID=1965230 RepID=UPI00303B0FA6
MNIKKSKKTLRAQLKNAAHLAHGSGKTRTQRQNHIGKFDRFLKQNNIQIARIEQIREKHIVRYFETRVAQGMKLRSLQNEASAIRQTLRASGRYKLADSPRISNKALKLNGASRAGTKVAISDTQYQAIHQKALQKNPGLAAALELARVLGLRGEEAVQSCQSLPLWYKALHAGATELKVTYGTKGGRPRYTQVINRERVVGAVTTALITSSRQNGKLIDKPNLKEAMSYWRTQCSALGLKGEISPHSLRYAFAQDALRYFQEQGHSRKEALALTSMSLGHGDGRGDYIKQVYCRNGGEYA